jgi:hypothetical protein
MMPELAAGRRRRWVHTGLPVSGHDRARQISTRGQLAEGPAAVINVAQARSRRSTRGRRARATSGRARSPRACRRAGPAAPLWVRGTFRRPLGNLEDRHCRSALRRLPTSRGGVVRLGRGAGCPARRRVARARNSVVTVSPCVPRPQVRRIRDELVESDRPRGSRPPASGAPARCHRRPSLCVDRLAASISGSLRGGDDFGPRCRASPCRARRHRPAGMEEGERPARPCPPAWVSNPARCRRAPSSCGIGVVVDDGMTRRRALVQASMTTHPAMGIARARPAARRCDRLGDEDRHAPRQSGEVDRLPGTRTGDADRQAYSR